MSVDGGSDHGDGDPEDDNDDDANGERGSSDGDKGDDDDDWYSEDDSDEENGEEYEEDDDEEEMDMSMDTTDSDTDDEPGYGSLLRHAREVYAISSFCIFEHEYKKSKTLNVDVIKEDYDERGLVFEYKLQKTGHNFREHKVTAMPLDGIIDCSCKHFDLVGILCCHAIIVLGCLRIGKIPDHHVLKWQTKNGNQLMDTVNVNKAGAKDDMDMRTNRVVTPLLRHTGEVYLPNIFVISRETYKKLDYLSVDTVRETFDRRGPIYEGKAKSPRLCRYHVDAPLLRHARHIFEPNIFPMFREEYKKSEHLFVWFIDETFDNWKLAFDCEVRKPRHSRYHKVHAEPNEGSVKCSCKGFENMGILCCHALSVLDCLFIERIPKQYILEKFMKNPGVGEVGKDIHGEKCSELVRFIRWRTLYPKLENLAKRASQSEETTNLVLEHVEKLCQFLGWSSTKDVLSATDKDSLIACVKEGARDKNSLGSTNATEDEGFKKAMGLNHDHALMKCNDEELEANWGQSTTTGGASPQYSSSPSPSPLRTSQEQPSTKVHEAPGVAAAHACAFK